MQMDHTQSLAVTPFQTFNDTLGERPVELTTLLIDGDSYFRGTDVAAALGYTDQKRQFEFRLTTKINTSCKF